MYGRAKIVKLAFWRTFQCTLAVQCISFPTFVHSRDTIVAQMHKQYRNDAARFVVRSASGDIGLQSLAKIVQRIIHASYKTFADVCGCL
jgi:hypothetical protein